ncbi:MAG: hypothetical protein KC415_03525 [Anaerolineales bacterium]|nr:hypothetical protein [Anaerolineales bacterium]
MAKKVKKFRGSRRLKPVQHQEPYITQFMGVKSGAWVWCLHCGRCYRVGEHRDMSDGLQYCAYADCNGDAVFDVWEWLVIRASHPEYPKQPERNKEYTL